jgi:hypothetical protein
VELGMHIPPRCTTACPTHPRMGASTTVHAESIHASLHPYIQSMLLLGSSPLPSFWLYSMDTDLQRSGVAIPCPLLAHRVPRACARVVQGGRSSTQYYTVHPVLAAGCCCGYSHPVCRVFAWYNVPPILYPSTDGYLLVSHHLLCKGLHYSTACFTRIALWILGHTQATALAGGLLCRAWSSWACHALLLCIHNVLLMHGQRYNAWYTHSGPSLLHAVHLLLCTQPRHGWLVLRPLLYSVWTECTRRMVGVRMPCIIHHSVSTECTTGHQAIHFVV